MKVCVNVYVAKLLPLCEIIFIILLFLFQKIFVTLADPASKSGGHMESAEHAPVTWVWGRAPSGVLVRRSGAKPCEAKSFFAFAQL